MSKMLKRLDELKNKGGKTLAVLTAMCALSSCVGPGGLPYIPNISAAGKNGAIGIGGGYYPYAPMMMCNPYSMPSMPINGIPGQWTTNGFYMGKNAAGQGVFRVLDPMLSVNAKDLITKQDVDGNEWQMAKGTKLPKAFKVIIAEDKTIPVPAAQYDQITAAMNKGELKFVVDANGQYGLVPTAAVKEFETATLTFEQIAKQAAAQKTQAKGKGSR